MLKLPLPLNCGSLEQLGNYYQSVTTAIDEWTGKIMFTIFSSVHLFSIALPSRDTFYECDFTTTFTLSLLRWSAYASASVWYIVPPTPFPKSPLPQPRGDRQE
jgi:hypothetical protein